MGFGRTAKQQVDYDALAPTYDRRFRHSEDTGITTGLAALTAEIEAQRILEVGCGTGHWLAALAAAREKGLQLYGLDLSAGMLARAQRQAMSLALARGRAEYLPVARRSLDLIYCVNAIHHFSDPLAFIQDVKQALRPGGALSIFGMDPRGHEADWYIYQYFPGVFANDLERFPSWGMIVDWLIGAGFERLRLEPAEIIHDPKSGAEVWNDPFLRKEAASQLVLLSQAEYEAGLQRIREAISQAGGAGVELIFDSNIYIYQLTAFLAHDIRP